MQVRKKDLIELIPLAILTIIGLYSIIEVMTTDYIFGIQQHVGLPLLGISIILFFTNRRIYKYIFGITLLLGLVNLIGFTTSTITMFFWGLPIQLPVLPIVEIFTWIHKEDIKSKIIEPIGSEVTKLIGKSDEQIVSNSNAKINGFKRRFEKLSDKEIEMKLGENIVPEAIEALKQIQKERANL